MLVTRMHLQEMQMHETEPCFTGNGEASPFALAPELHQLSPQNGLSPVKGDDDSPFTTPGATGTT